MQEFIRTHGLKGFRKSEIEVLVRNPNGQQRRVLLGELAFIRQDKRHRKRKDYVTVLTLSQSPRSDLTYNIATNRFSVTFHSGYHHAYIRLDDLQEAALIAALYLLLHRNKRLNLQFIGASYNALPLLSKYFVQSFRKKIHVARRTWHKSTKARRTRH